MVIQEEIQRLKMLGLTQRNISKTLDISRNTVKKYWNPVEHNEDIHLLPDWAIAIDWDYVDSELKRTSRKILFEELKAQYPLPHYSNFCRYLQSRQITQKAVKGITMRIERVPGHSIEVDYSGDGWPVLIPSTGEIKMAQLFVGTMSYSGYIYAEFTWTQAIEDWIEAHKRMFYFLEGTPKYIIPDNCKTAIRKKERYDDIVNPTYQDLCTHYQIVVDAARVRHPQDKPNVERAVGIIQQDFFPRIRHKTFLSLMELNQALREYIKTKNKEVIKGRNQSREALFAVEYPLLTSLPSQPYEIFYFKKAKVHADCHIQHAHNTYSVPYRYCGKEVDVRYNQNMVYISYNCEILATHKAMKGHGHSATKKQHYPEQKIVDAHNIILRLTEEATRIGPHNALLVETLFKTLQHPLKNLRKVQGIISLSKKFSNEAMEYAANTALTYNKLYYAFIKECADNFVPHYNVIQFKAPKRSAGSIYLRGEHL